MTPKEKAIELVEKYYDKIEDVPIECGMYCLGGTIDRKLLSKQCALIAVDLLISETFLDFYVKHPQPFWEEVKTELEKL